MLLALLIFGIVLIFVPIPHGTLIAASIFLDIPNVFWFFLRIFSGGRD